MRVTHSSGVRFEVTMVAFLRCRGDDQLVEVGGGRLVERLQGEVVDDQHAHGGEAAVLGFGGVVEPGGLELLEQLVGAGHVDGEAAADGDVAEGGGQVRLADPDGPRMRAPWPASANRRLASSFQSCWS